MSEYTRDRNSSIDTKITVERALMVTAASECSSTIIKAFLGQNRGGNASTLRDVVSLGSGKFAMVRFNSTTTMK